MSQIVMTAPKPQMSEQLERETRETRALIRTAERAVSRLANKSQVVFIGRARAPKVSSGER
jgi:hypothetical protein